MKDFADFIKNIKIPEGRTGVFFLGQAGFVLKTDDGRLIAYDLYLSDCCEREFGFKRLIAKLLLPDEIEFDAVICSHGHYDHLDIDSIDGLAGAEKTELYTPRDGIEELEKLALSTGSRKTSEKARLIEKGGSTVLCGGRVRADFVYCDHGPDTPYAVGTVFYIKGKRFYFAGDTALHIDLLVNEKTKYCDFAALPINGAFGNLDAREAIELAKELGAGITVPCHFGNFAEHGGDPGLFKELAAANNIKYAFMTQGELMIV